MNQPVQNVDRSCQPSRTDGGREARELFEFVYDELRQIAVREMRREPAGITLQATALVNELWLKIVASREGPVFNSRSHFLLAAANAMRCILIDAARNRQRKKRGGKEWNRVDFHDAPMTECDDNELLDLDEALEELSLVDPIKSDLVKLRFFAGLTNAEASQQLNISTATAERYWVFAKAWLRAKMKE